MHRDRGGMRGSMGQQPPTGAYRFSFATKDDEFTFLNKPSIVTHPAVVNNPPQQTNMGMSNNYAM